MCSILYIKGVQCLAITVLPSMTNKMHRYKIFFIAVNALHVSGLLSEYHQERGWVSSNPPTLAVAASKLYIFRMLGLQS
jgi:hypothetical protein